MQFGQVKEKILECFHGLEGNQSIYVSGPDGDITLHAEQPVSSASIIKIGILLEALRQIDNHQLAFDQVVQIDNVNDVGGAGVIHHLSRDYEWKLADLLKLMIISSDNTATNQLIDLVGENKINHTMKAAGAFHSKLMRKMMDRSALKLGMDNMVSGKDTYLVLREFVTQHLLSKSSMEWGVEVLLQQQFKDKFPSKIASIKENLLAHKTGELNGVEHDAGILFTSDGPVVYAFLTAGLLENRYGREAIANAGRLLYDFYH
ncbi:serine hydrolase [Bacillus sp. RAR_GA_16]|uniref:serine hydrolase n=1 Tax=Bacillus sp. RAR_GA_16 TaxID=2876774 RepID=UPI001CCA8B5D|nr:serine hydrolase [Bacillus sp. RAR_GA_16]MCA0174135.1 class A beta-lactamase-related serine hydrolase [Bacillus sp. RAR_GA_16]